MKLFGWLRRRDHSAESITAYIDGELSAAERARFEADLRQSPQLQQEVETERVLKAVLKSALPEVPAPRSFALTEEMVGRTHAAPAPGWFNLAAMRTAQATAAVAVFAFVTLIVVDLGNTTRNDGAGSGAPASLESDAASGMAAADDKSTDPAEPHGTPMPALGAPGGAGTNDGPTPGDFDSGTRSSGARETAGGESPDSMRSLANRDSDGGMSGLRLAQAAMAGLAILAIGTYLAARTARRRAI
jgi:hypothetical protein